MKKLIVLLILFFILPVLVWAGPGYMVFDSNAVPAAGCSTPTGNVLSESFGDCASGCSACVAAGSETCENTWTISGDSDSFHIELPSAPWTGDGCTYGLLHDTSNENGERIYLDMPGDAVSYETSTDVVFTLYVSSDTKIDANQTIWFYAIGAANSAVNFTGALLLNNIGGTLYLKAYGSTLSSGPAISTDTKHTVKLHLDATNTDSYVQLDGGDTYTFTRADQNKQYAVIGSLSNEGAGEALKFYVGNIYVTNP